MKYLYRDDLKYTEIPSKTSQYMGLHILLQVWTSTSDLPTLNIYLQTFFWKKYGSEIPYLPTIWTYFQNFLVFFNPLLSAKLDAAVCCVVEVIRLKKEVEKGIRKKAMKAGKEENEKLC